MQQKSDTTRQITRRLISDHWTRPCHDRETLTLLRHVLRLQEPRPSLHDLARPRVNDRHDRQRVAVHLVQAAELLALVRRPVVLRASLPSAPARARRHRSDRRDRTCQKTKPLSTKFCTTSSDHVSRLSMWLANMISSWMFTSSHLFSFLACMRACSTTPSQ